MKYPMIEALKSIFEPQRGMNGGELTAAFNSCAAEAEVMLEPYWEQGLIGIVVDGGNSHAPASYELIFRDGSLPDLKQLPETIGAFKVKASYHPVPKAL